MRLTAQSGLGDTAVPAQNLSTPWYVQWPLDIGSAFGTLFSFDAANMGARAGAALFGGGSAPSFNSSPDITSTVISGPDTSASADAQASQVATQTATLLWVLAIGIGAVILLGRRH